MSLLAYNKTTSPLALAAGSVTISQVASSAGARSKAHNVTAELNALSSGDFASIQVQVDAGSVEFEWSTGIPEFNTYTLVVGQAAEEFSENDVSTFTATTGSDTNPGTQAQPYATPGKMAKTLRGNWRRSNVFYLGDGTYNWAEFGFHGGNGGVGPGSSPLAIVGNYNTIVGGPFTVTAVNPDGSLDVSGGIPALTSGTGDSFAFVAPYVTLTDSAGGFVAGGVKTGMSITIAGATTPANNGTFLITAVSATTVTFFNQAGVAEAYAGGWNVTFDRFFNKPKMRVISGPGTGATAMVAGNTDAALLPNYDLPLNWGVDVGSVIQIEDPSTIIQMSVNTIFAWMHVGMKGIKFQRIAGGGLTLAEDGQLDVEGCILDISTGGNSRLRIVHNGRLQSSAFGPWSAMGGSNPFQDFGLGLCVEGRTNNLNVSMFDRGSMIGTHQFNMCRLGVISGYLDVQAIHMRNSSIDLSDNSTLFVETFDGGAVRSTMKGNHPQSPWVIGGFNNSNIGRLNVLNIDQCNGNPIQLGQDAQAGVTGYGGSRAWIGDVGGSDNVGVGIKYTGGSRATIDGADGYPNTTITGTAGDTEGRRPTTDTQTYATVRTADGSGVKGYQDSYGNRIEPAV